MKYVYYPGCSLEGACSTYDRSLRKVMSLLGHELVELDDWNCCGATMYMSFKETVALSVSARNLALAEQAGDMLVAPCSACYTTLRKTNRYMRELPELRKDVNAALAEAGLHYNLSVKVRHPLDLLINNIGVEAITRKATTSLRGMKIAPYYGCLIVRPEPGFDDQDWPTSMDDLFAALGAECVYFPDRVRCCGGMLTTTNEEVGEELSANIMECAVRNGANVILTTCPLCQMNLETAPMKGHSEKVGAGIPVLCFTQLLGIALGAGPEEMDIHRGLIPIGDSMRDLVGA